MAEAFPNAPSRRRSRRLAQRVTKSLGPGRLLSCDCTPIPRRMLNLGSPRWSP
jgi:hypothetical protein